MLLQGRNMVEEKYRLKKGFRDPVVLAETLFRIPNAQGKLIKYHVPEPHKELLRTGLMGDKTVLARVIDKGRQIGYSYLLAAECIMIAQKYPNVGQFYVATESDQGKEFMRKINVLIENSMSWPDGRKVIEDYNLDNMMHKTINGGFIKAFRASPGAARSYTGINIILDEFAWMISEKSLQDELAAAMRPFLLQGGQVTIVSTPRVTMDKFWEIYTNADTLGFKSYYRPTIENWEKIDLTQSLIEQKCDIPYPWVNIDELEKERLADKFDDFRKFKREVLGIPSDEEYLLFPRELVMRCAKRPEDGGIREVDSLVTSNRVVMGVDVASVVDVTAVSVAEETTEGLIERYVTQMQGDYTVQETKLLDIINRFKPTEIRIDNGGPGIVLADFLEQKIGFHKIRRVNFNESVEVSDYGQEKKVPIKMYMIMEMKKAMQDGRFVMLNEKPVHAEALQHLMRVGMKETETSVRISGKEFGRDDHAWAKALLFVKGKPRMAYGYLG